MRLALTSMIARTAPAAPKDIVKTKKALAALDLFKPGEFGFTDFTERALFDGIEAFQKRAGLPVTGKIESGDKTEAAINQALAVGERTEADTPRRDHPSAASLLADASEPRPDRAPETGDLADLIRPRFAGDRGLRDDLTGNMLQFARAEADQRRRRRPLDENVDGAETVSLLGDPEERRRAKEFRKQKEIREFIEAQNPLPPPTNEPVDLQRFHEILQYDPDRGGGDNLSIALNPALAMTTRDLAHKARDVAKIVLPRGPDGNKLTGFDDDQDAFRHALGSYLITRRFGPSTSKRLLDGHERAPRGEKNPDNVILMDLYNNRVGRDAAINPENFDKDPVEVIMNLYRAGKLQTRPFRLKSR